MKNKRVGFIIALIVPLLILLSLTIKPLLTLNYGEEVSLETVPVDPRDLLYGDHVLLSYKIEEVPRGLISDDLLKDMKQDHRSSTIKVYGKLKQEGDFNVLEEVTAVKPSSGIYLQGKINTYSYVKEEETTLLNVDFGLERYFVPEGSGKELENLSQQGKIIAHLKVRNGYALLTKIEAE